MLELFLAAATSVALTAAAPALCLPADPAEVVTEHRVLDRDEGQPLQVYAVSHRGEDGPFGYDSSRVVIYDAACGVRHLQVFDGAVETHFRSAKLGDQSVLVATVMYPGGSGVGYEQVILGYDTFSVYALAPERLRYSNMDGFYLGDLGGGRGDGLILWMAIWDGAHYDPHRYTVTTYRWRDGHFSGPEVRTTHKRYDPDPDTVAKALGLPADQTDMDRFKLFDAR